MAKITVYYFTKGDITAGQTIRSQHLATLAKISKLGGEPIKETATEINESDLDGNGFYIPPLSKKNPDSKS